ncbi:DUF4214 domain-containing protein [Subtercola lobariae]|uniref:DUF4214 domain-containing protein n=1 Tax=Subtercola lobariae TaxID=1588641 RepID=A0A917BET2_9MICO|nr:DUF4214 domain-containing protein [Subtercola lobariae]GGF40042.1 hypothetical protein GCM10011399_36150 [Subtercola lobariae]
MFAMKRALAVAAASAVVLGSVLVSTPAFAAPDTITISGHVSLGTASAGAGTVDISLIRGFNAPSVVVGTVDAAGDYSVQVAKGSYFLLEVDNVGPGNYAPYLSAPFASSSCTVDSQDYTSASADIAGWDIALPVGGELSGTVRNLQGSPVSGVEVWAYDQHRCVTLGDGQPSTKITVPNTDETGTYDFKNLDATGAYQVEFYSGAAEPTTYLEGFLGMASGAPRGIPYTVATGQVRSGADMTLVQGGSVQGSVSCASCDLSQLDPSKFVISIEGYNASAGTWVSSSPGYVQRDGAGLTYRTPATYPGDYRISLSYPDDAFQRMSTQTFSISEGAVTTENLALASTASTQPGVPAAINSYITSLYKDFLGRTPGASEIAFWAGKLKAGWPRSSISTGFANSDEYRLIRIDAAYESVLHRQSDPQGRLFWLDRMQRGLTTTDEVEMTYYASQEYYDDGGGNDAGYVTGVYLALLNRLPSQADISFWSAIAQRQGRMEVVKDFWNSTETVQKRVSAMYALYLGRTPDPSGLTTWTNFDLANGDSLTRSTLTSSDEYYNRAATRFPVA